MPFSEKSVIGAEIIKTLPDPNTFPIQPDNKYPGITVHDACSTNTLTPRTSNVATFREDGELDHAHPSSAFYCHPTTRSSFERAKSESQAHIKVYDVDVEAARSMSVSEGPRKECTVWPGKQTLAQKARLAKKSRGCSPLRNLTKQQKLWAKILIALVIIGAAVGIGIGISRAVGGGVWKGNNPQGTIGG
ncbi:MAG: hypothetical protein M1827_000731 [Pycnora praestabilis]|nr:MAG: hypothetical protein M1827_000731 [Pycnora praestabilis]